MFIYIFINNNKYYLTVYYTIIVRVRPLCNDTQPDDLVSRQQQRGTIVEFIGT